MTADNPFFGQEVWVQNQGAACTTASLLIAMGLLGVPGLPALGPATLALGAAQEYGAPGLLDYVTLPGRRAPLDLRVEALAGARGFRLRSSTGLVAPPWRPRTRPGGVLIAHCAWGQERPGVYGAWGFSLFRRSTWSTGGHSVVVVDSEPPGWRVYDPNRPGIQEWPRPGLAVTATRLGPV